MPKYTSSAKVVDGSLVLSLPDAVTPVVMRLSLDEAKSAAFTVLEKKGQHVLTVQFSEKESRDIAPFAEKDLAIAALMSASAALEKGSHLSAMDGQDHARAPISIKGLARWGGAICALLFLIWVISAVNNSMPRAPFPAGTTQTAPITDPQKTSGVPLSADDFLNRK
ncbi:MAG: hypothetical protein H6855_00880 [Rhodospirillales bacterium]|nr:hypothetical protein [Rhodospirillales bacterium]MCB9964623.1 hypothetical protein [Rhodospirillales bacterium]MCB9979913.1 hypothetical protein [Rhodospirillales bacterium]